MKIRTIGYWFLTFGSLCLLWSASARPVCAGQNYPRHVTVFGQSSAATAPAPKVAPAEEADIRQLMDLVGTKATVQQMMSFMDKNLRPLLLHAFPPGPYRERLIELFLEKFNAKATPQYVMNLAIPFYAQYFSDADIKGLIQFYETPLGQKWARTLPKLRAALLAESQSLGGQLGRQTMIEVLRQHPHLAQEFVAAQHAAHSRPAGGQ